MASTIDRTDITVDDDSGTPENPVGDGTTANNAWVQGFLDAIDDLFSGNLTIGGVFTAASLAISGAISAASLTISGALSAATASFSGAVTMASTLAVTGAASLSSTLSVATSIRERGRLTPLGEWIDVPFSAGNFNADAGGPVSWAVTAGDQVMYRYTLIGKTMILAFNITGTDVPNAGSVLLLSVPGGHTVAPGSDFQTVIRVSNAGSFAAGIAQAASGQGQIRMFATLTAGTFSLTAGGNTTVMGVITFAIA